MDTNRVLLAVFLSLGLILLYQELVLRRITPPPNQLAQGSKPVLPGTNGAATSSPGISSTENPTNQAQPFTGPAASALQPASPAGPEKIFTIDSEDYVAQITSRGGRIKSFRLKHYFETANQSSGWYELVPQTGDYVLPLGAIVQRGDQTLTDAAMDYSTTAPERTALGANGTATLTMESHTADGTTIRKALNFRGDSYAFTTDLNVIGGPRNDAIGLALSQPLNPHLGYYDIPELQADVNGSTMNEAEKALRKGVAPVTGSIIYAGFGDRYFLTAYLPTSPPSGTLTMTFIGDQALARLLFSGADRLQTRAYMGPKLLEALEGVDPVLHKSIDFGWAPSSRSSSCAR